MRAAVIFFFARVTRAAIVGSLTRKACAISGVVSPQTSRSVRATWASRASAGWQQVNTSRSRSSAMSPPSSRSPGPSSVISGSTSRGSLVRSVEARRSASSALRLAVVVSQAPGLRGTPSRSQASTAVRNASWAHSSARSRSRVRRTVAVSTWAHSRRCASASASRTSSRCAAKRSALLRELHDRAHLDPAERRRAQAADLQGVVEVLGLDEVEAAERLLGLRERAVGDDVAADRGGGGGRLQGVAAQDLPTELDHLLGEPVVRRHRLLPDAGVRVVVAGLVLVAQDQVLSHRGSAPPVGVLGHDLDERAAPESTAPVSGAGAREASHTAYRTIGGDERPRRPARVRPRPPVAPVLLGADALDPPPGRVGRRRAAAA